MPAEISPVSQNTKSYEELLREGWELHASRKDEDLAESVFRQAIALDSKPVDAYYGLGLVLKSQDRRKEAIQAFEKVVELLDSHAIQDRTRRSILRRLALGHINQLKSGDWGLEREVWQREE